MVGSRLKNLVDGLSRWGNSSKSFPSDQPAACSLEPSTLPQSSLAIQPKVKRGKSWTVHPPNGNLLSKDRQLTCEPATSAHVTIQMLASIHQKIVKYSHDGLAPSKVPGPAQATWLPQDMRNYAFWGREHSISRMWIRHRCEKRNPNELGCNPMDPAISSIYIFNKSMVRQPDSERTRSANDRLDRHSGDLRMQPCRCCLLRLAPEEGDHGLEP